jgi:hypothetical protein
MPAQRAPGPYTLAARLSGGNQQKIVVARELDRKPAVVIAQGAAWPSGAEAAKAQGRYGRACLGRRADAGAHYRRRRQRRHRRPGWSRAISSAGWNLYRGDDRRQRLSRAGVAEAFELRLQSFSVPVSSYVVQMAPYLIAPAVLAGLGRTSRMPAAIGQPLPWDR